MPEAKTTGPVPFNYTFGPIQMEFHTFLQNVDGWGPNDVEVTYVPGRPQLPADIAANYDKTIAAKEADAKKNNKVFFDGQQIRMLSYGHRVTGNDEANMRLALTFGDGSYFWHATTGQVVDKEFLVDASGNPTSIRKKYIQNPYAFDDPLGNSVGVSTVIISKPDNAIVYVRRSDKITQYPGRLGVAAAGFMDRKKDLTEKNGVLLPDPFKTMQRETTEEMGLKTEYGQFGLTGVGRVWDDLHGELWGVTRVDETVAQIKSTPKKQKYESLAIYDIPFEPRKVLPTLKNAGSTWVNAHAVATIDALLQEFKTEDVLAAAEELAA